MIDPRAVADRHPIARIRALARLAIDVTERPWALTAADLARARGAGLTDAAVLHTVLQSSLFGHLNRMADAVGVAADYPDSFGAPHAEPATPPYLPAGSVPDPGTSRPIDLAAHPSAPSLLSAWRAHALDRDAPLTRRHRTVVAATVAAALGDATVGAVAAAGPLEQALADLATIVTLAPWRLGPAAFAPLRAAGLADDEAVFDAIATASSCTVFSRMAVVLSAFAR